MISRLVPRLLDCGKSSNTLTTQMVTATFNQLVSCIRSESDASFLVSLYKCFTDSLLVIGGRFNLPQEYRYSIIDATKHQLQVLADKRKGRSIRLARAGEVDGLDKEDVSLYEQLEEFMLQEMERLLSELLDGNEKQVLRIAISSVRDLGLNDWDDDDNDNDADLDIR